MTGTEGVVGAATEGVAERLPRAGGGVVARAPLRISFAGGGTDLPAYYERHGGLVVSAAITRHCRAAARPPADGGIAIHSADYGRSERLARGEPLVVKGPLRLPEAAVEWFMQRGHCLDGVELRIACEVPPGSGLGSSSALAVALVSALAAGSGLRLSAGEVAELACWLEIERLGMPIGKQDQYASAFGGLNAIEFSASGVRVSPLRLSPATAAALRSRLLLFWTGRSRDSASILGQQRAESRSDPAVIASLHRLKALAAEVVAALVAEDLDRFGRLLDHGWQVKKRLSPRISSAAIDAWYAAAREAGALGGKVTGAGGGGFLLLYCPPRHQPALRAAMARCGLREMEFDFDETGATVVDVARVVPAEQW